MKKLLASALVSLFALWAVYVHHYTFALGQGSVKSPGTTVGQAGRYPADRGTFWSVTGTKTDTTDLTVHAAPSAGVSVYIYMAYCVNNSASTVSAATITYGSTLVAAVDCSPASKSVQPTYFNPPLQIPAATAVTMQAVASATTNAFFVAGTLAR